MEALSMLRYWRGGGGGGGGGGRETTVTTTTTIATTAPPAVEETKKSSATEDEGPFFDLEFAMPDEDEETEEDDETEEEEEEEDDGEEEDMTEFNFTLSSRTGSTDPNVSPADDLFFKGHLVPLEPSDSKSTQFPVSLLKSATKFRVFFLGFKKPKSAVESNDGPQKQSKFFTVKFKVEEVPLVSLFTRDNSSRAAASAAVGGGKPPKAEFSDESGVLSERDARRAKDVVQKYLKMIKPLYVRVSKRYGEKLRFSGQLSLGSGRSGSMLEGGNDGVGSVEVEAAPSPVKNQNQTQNQTQNQKQGSFPASLRVVCKHLGKSRSASSSATGMQAVLAQKKRDDSLLQQQDGIQSAIAHCKRSFNSAKEASQFCRDVFEDGASLTRSSEKGKGISF